MQLRITPLNIAAGLLLFWICWRILSEELSILIISGLLLLVVLVIVTDQFFRLMLQTLQRIWLVETGFILFAVLVIWMVKLVG